jgi:hypothetical protein
MTASARFSDSSWLDVILAAAALADRIVFLLFLVMMRSLSMHEKHARRDYGKEASIALHLAVVRNPPTSRGFRPLA